MMGDVIWRELCHAFYVFFAYKYKLGRGVEWEKMKKWKVCKYDGCSSLFWCLIKCLMLCSVL